MFKVGDKVVRIGASSPFHYMYKGETYTVSSIISQYEIKVVECPFTSFLSKNFTLLYTPIISHMPEWF